MKLTPEAQKHIASLCGVASSTSAGTVRIGLFLILLFLFTVNLSRGQSTLDRGLVLYCPFSGSIEDKGPFQNTLEPHNIEFTEGVVGEGISFNGINGYLDILDNPSLNMGESDFSISLWLRFSYLTDGYASVLSKVEETGYPYTGIGFFVGNLRDEFSTEFRTTGAYSLFSHTSRLNQLNNGLWKHIVLVRRGRDLEIYVNGGFINSVSLPLTNVSNNGNIRIGCNSENIKMQRFSGDLDELRIYNRALRGDEIGELSNQSGLGVFDYLAGVAVLLAGLAAIWYYRRRPSGLSIAFDNISSIGIRGKVSFSLLYTLCCYFWIFPLACTFSDAAFFGGDTWEYQSLAVNFAKGHGISKFGQFEEFHEYKFDRHDENLLPAFEAKAYESHILTDDFYRTPGYPLFLGIVYKIFGVHPLIAKHIQLLLLIIIASCLPWIGAHFWGRSGFWAGFVAGILYVVIHHDSAGILMTEPLTAFCVFLVTIALIFFVSRGTRLSSVLLGVALGVSLLVKGSLIFVPAILAVALLWRAYRQKNIELFKRLVFVGGAMILTILPWSTYASIKSGKLIVLSTQGENVFLDGNNEHADDGGWHPEWHQDDDSFYNSDAVRHMSWPVKVMKFHLKYLNRMPTVLKAKLTRAFSPLFALWVIFLLIIIDYWGNKIRQMSNSFAYSVFMLATLTGLLMSLALSFVETPYGEYLMLLSRTNLNFRWTFFIVLTATIVAVSIDRKTRLSIEFPLALTAFFLNFIILTLLTFGESRFVGVMDFMFILVAFQYLAVIFRSYYNKAFAPGSGLPAIGEQQSGASSDN